MEPDYPPASQGDRVSSFHGHAVPDPYAWLDDDSRAETRAWRSAQARLTAEVLAGLPERTRLRRLLEGLPFDVQTRLPIQRGDRCFRFGRSRNGGASVLVASHGAAMTGTVAFDPADHEDVRRLRLQPQYTYVSPSGRYAAAGLVEPGSDWVNLRLVDLQRQCVLPGSWPLTAQLTVAWTADERAFYYNVTRKRFAESPVRDGVYRHDLHGSPGADPLVFDHSTGGGHAALPLLLSDGTLLVKTLDFVTQIAGLHVRGRDGAWRCVLPASAPCNVVGEHGGELFVETALDAPRGRIVALRLGHGGAMREVVAERDTAIEMAHHATRSPMSALCGDAVFVTYLEHAAHRVRMFGTDGVERGALPLPDPCTVLELAPGDAGVEAAVTSYTVPYARYRAQAPGFAGMLVERTEASTELSTAHVTQSFCVSRDGTRVPYVVVKPAGARAPMPTLLYGYGGWGMSLTPQYRVDLAAWVELGGAYAVAITRGGGEYGAGWHAAGAKLNRPRTFEDFCAVAQALVDAGVCAAHSLAARGLSNGGLLVAASIQHCPRLFAAAAIEVPLVDVLHLHDLPAGAAMVAEFGDPRANSDDFACIRAYSPLQNVEVEPARPAILVAPAERDERVSAGQACKYVAALQATATPGQFALLRMVEGEGHVDWAVDVQREVLSDELAFLYEHATTATSTGGH